MPVGIIDFRQKRRDQLAEVLRQMGMEVNPVSRLGSEDMNAELILLHVGLEQQDRGDNIAALLDRLQRESWILCYYGGAAVDAATNHPSPSVALFGESVGATEPSDAFTRVVRKVVAGLPQRALLRKEWFRDTVTGFDPLLEAKLQVLEAVLKGVDLPEDAVEQIRLSGAYTDAFENKGSSEPGELIVRHGTAYLRRIFFHEALCELQVKSRDNSDNGGER